MISTAMLVGLVMLAIASTLIAGVFQTFSEFVMKALGEVKHGGGIESMQWINRKVFRTGFMVMLIGLVVLSPVVAVTAWLYLPAATAIWIIGGSLLYVVGTFVVTLAFNVPLNNRLEVMDAASAITDNWWPTYIRRWTFWNHVRGLAALGAAVCYLFAAFKLH